jgi:transposase
VRANRNRKFVDSPLEGDGFELLVPRHESPRFPKHPGMGADQARLRHSAEARLDRLTRQIEELQPSWSMAPVIAALQAMRGVALVVAVTLVAEVGDFRRFANARQLDLDRQ